MGITKPNNYSGQELRLSLMAQAIAHPARMRIINLLKKHQVVKLKSLPQQLNLSKSTINKHLVYLRNAELVSVEQQKQQLNLRFNTGTWLHLTSELNLTLIT